MASQFARKIETALNLLVRGCVMFLFSIGLYLFPMIFFQWFYALYVGLELTSILWMSDLHVHFILFQRERLAVETVKLFSPGMNQQDRSFWSYLIGYNCGALIILGNANRELDQRAKALAEEREAL